MDPPHKSRGSLSLNLLGGFHVTSSEVEFPPLDRKKTRGLLAILALDAGRMVSREKLLAILWEDHEEDSARHGLRQCLLDLRQSLADAKVDALRSDGDLIGLERSMVIVDVVCLQQHIAVGTTDSLSEAVRLYRGELLEGFSLKARAFEDWLHLERERLRTQVLGAMRRVLSHHVRAKAADLGIELGLRLLVLEPLDETVHRALMVLYSESGRRSAALGQYEECVELLHRELGVEPEPDTRDLYRRLVAERTPSQRPRVSEDQRESRPVRAHRSRLPGASATWAPLIGRSAELEWLDTLGKRAVRGQPQLVFVEGEAGIGKSHLVGEVVSRAQQHGAKVLFGRGRDGEDVLAFAPWLEAIRPALSEELFRRLPAVTRRDLTRLLPERADGAGPPPSGLEDGIRIFEAVATLLRELATKHPLVIVIEDLHWCDDMTVRLLRFVPRRLHGRDVVLIGTSRPEELRESSGPGAALEALRADPACASRTLGPLRRSEATQLFRALLPSRDHGRARSLIERMWHLSEGNPFVVVECARAVRDRGGIGSGTGLELPEQVRMLTDRFLTNLTERAARLAIVAAVIGRDFAVGVLRHAADFTEADVADGMEELVRRRVLREVDGRFEFGHDRVREATYAGLLGPRRALLHRKVAEALEAVYASNLDLHCAAIGAHYRAAGVWNQACDYLARAGFQAWERGAGREAVACFEDALQAMAALSETEERRELNVRMRMTIDGARVGAGSYAGGRGHLHEAEIVAGRSADRRWTGRVAVALCRSYRGAGDLDRSIRYGDLALDVARQTSDRALELAARFVLGTSHSNAGNFRQSLQHLATLLSDDARPPDWTGWLHQPLDKLAQMRAWTRYWMAINHLQLGEFEAGMRLAEDTLQEGVTLGDSLGSTRVIAHISMGKLHTAVGDFAAALQDFEAASAVYREECHGNSHSQLNFGLGLVYALLGRVTEALRQLEKTEMEGRQIDPGLFPGFRYLMAGRAFIALGRIDQAARMATEAHAAARQGGNRPQEAGAHGLLAEVASLRNPVPHAEMEDHLVKALIGAEALEMRPLAARCHLRLAWLYEMTGRPEFERHRAAAETLRTQIGQHVQLEVVGVH